LRLTCAIRHEVDRGRRLGQLRHRFDTAFRKLCAGERCE
jgi:hypothetical protein